MRSVSLRCVFSTIFSCLRSCSACCSRASWRFEQAFAVVQFFALPAQLFLGVGLLLHGRFFDYQLGLAAARVHLLRRAVDDLPGLRLGVAHAEPVEQTHEDGGRDERRHDRNHNGQCNGIFSSVGMIGDVKREFGRALESDSGYALAWYALGRLYAALPPLLGGSLNLAEGYLRRGLAADSNHTIIRLELARVYLRQRRRAEARRELHALLATVQPTNPAEFTLSDRPAALELLNSIEATRKQPPRS